VMTGYLWRRNGDRGARASRGAGACCMHGRKQAGVITD
jgi:hypothetical protein